MHDDKPLLDPKKRVISFSYWKKNVPYGAPLVIRDRTNAGGTLVQTSDDRFVTYLFADGIKFLTESAFRTFIHRLKQAERKNYAETGSTSAIIFFEEQLRHELKPEQYRSVLDSEHFEATYVAERRSPKKPRVRRGFAYVPPRRRDQARQNDTIEPRFDSVESIRSDPANLLKAWRLGIPCSKRAADAAKARFFLEHSPRKNVELTKAVEEAFQKLLASGKIVEKENPLGKVLNIFVPSLHLRHGRQRREEVIRGEKYIAYT